MRRGLAQQPSEPVVAPRDGAADAVPDLDRAPGEIVGPGGRGAIDHLTISEDEI